MRADRDGGGPRSVVWFVVLFDAVAALAAALTLLFLAMRGALTVGGSCGSGDLGGSRGYRSTPACPPGVAASTLLAIVGGAAASFVALWARSKVRAPLVVPLAWPALFISLGWNFLEHGLAPSGSAGVEVGFLVCGVVFELMGVVPLLVGLSVVRDGRRRRRATAHADEVRHEVPIEDAGPGGTMLSSTWLPTAGPLPAEVAVGDRTGAPPTLVDAHPWLWWPFHLAAAGIGVVLATVLHAALSR